MIQLTPRMYINFVTLLNKLTIEFQTSDIKQDPSNILSMDIYLFTIRPYKEASIVAKVDKVEEVMKIIVRYKIYNIKEQGLK